jgi:hypothetical protein
MFWRKGTTQPELSSLFPCLKLQEVLMMVNLIRFARVKRGYRRYIMMALVLSFLICTQGLVLAQSAQVVVRPEPMTMAVEPGTETAVALMFEDVQELYGLEIQLMFDPAVLEVVDADASKPDVQIQAEDWLNSGFVAVNRVDNVNGTINFAATLLNPAPPVSGSKNFAQVTFRAKDSGVSQLTIENAILSTRDGVEIAFVGQNGQVEVGSAGGSGLFDSGESFSIFGNAGSPARTIAILGIALFAFSVLGSIALIVNKRFRS